MPYTKTTWVSGVTAIDAVPLNNLEKQYDEAIKGRTFTELAGGENHQVTGNDAWENWDISLIVPVGTKSVIVVINVANFNALAFGARANGSALVRRIIGTQYHNYALVTEVDANRIIDCYTLDAFASVFFSILGYWS